MIDFILANLEFIAMAIIALITVCVLLFAAPWSGVAFISAMGSWLREDFTVWLHRAWKRINR